MPSGSERAVLSDVLPYELPVSFGNVSFVELLARLNIEFVNKKVEANWLGPATPAVLSLLLGGAIQVPRPICGQRVTFDDPSNSEGKHQFIRAKPLSYNIGKNSGGVRSVTLMHPRTQVSVAGFYSRYADLILYYTTRSPYSIRYPKEVARYTVSRDGVFSSSADVSASGVEQDDREYDQLRSYFIYGGYSHIYKFYESAEARRLERRFSRLVHVDITRCFDSIYTHTISWVTNGIQDSKTRIGAADNTFGGRFDKLMQSANDLETHGIVIGPEVSRIFAEIILQEVDVRVERKLRETGSNLTHRENYEIRRFVDDYFIYCSSEEDADRIVTALGDELKHFKLYLNDAKRKDETTPLAAEKSVAKYQLKLAIERQVNVECEDDSGRLPLLVTSVESLLLEYKGALLGAGLEHADLANYALVQIEFAFEQALHRWRRIAFGVDAPPITESDWAGLVRFISSIVDVSAAIFAGGVSASHSVKLARICHTALKFMEVAQMPQTLRAGVESKIESELVAQIRRPASNAEAPMHTLILLDALTPMRENGSLTDRALRNLINLSDGSPNAIALLTVLRYCGNQNELAGLRSDIEKLAIDRAKDAFTSHALDTDATLLASALIDSPFQSMNFKRELIAKLQLPGRPRPGGSALWASFFDWQVPDYYEALQNKRGGDVY